MDLFPLLRPPGNDTEVPFNDGGLFGSDSTFTFNKTTDTLTVGSAVIGPSTAVFQPLVADSTSAFQWKNKAGNVLINLDTTNGETHLNPDATGDVILFADTDVGDAVHGNSLFVHRKAAEGDGHIELFVDNGRLARFDSDRPMRFASPSNIIFEAGGTYTMDVGTNDWFQVRDHLNSVLFFIAENTGFTGLGGEIAPETLLELTHATPTITGHVNTHSDADGSGAWILRGKREDGAGTETESGTMTFSHDGAGVNDQLTKWVLGVNSGSGVVTAMAIGSDRLLEYTGNSLFQPHTNSTTAFQWKDQAGNSIVNIDTTKPILTLQSTDASDPTFTFKTTNTPNQMDISLDESGVDDILIFRGRTASQDSYIQLIAQVGEGALLELKSGNNGALFSMSSASNLTFRNKVIDKNIRFDVNIGGSNTEVMTVEGSTGNFGIREPAPETAVELTHATPTWTTHGSTHSDADNATAGKWAAKREDGAGTETESGTMTFSHDGSGVNDQLAKWVLGVNTGAGVVDAITVDSSRVVTIPGIGDGGLTNYDLKIGTTGTPTYGMIQIGNSVIGRTSYKVGNIDLDGAILVRNIGGPVTSEIEFIWTESTGDTCRFALPKSAVGNATYNSRSMLLAGPAPADTDFVKVTYWQGQGIFDNLACDTAGDGADLGVQNDLEVEGDIFVDSIKESTSGLSVAFGNDVSFVDGKNIILNTTTGTKIGTATTQKLSFWNVAPVVQPAHIIDADGTLGDITTKFNTLLAQMATTGLQAAA